ncbi:hypothetical protein POM88_015716 [Heracleum sosnowskyi]|uniref:non-specific serine/threonine protein kinase n=1 Tax=Heracleum sosnowskyi TaxID=360622 RepID=A0AAD8IMP9_9APIA|nr:hypothetical protein POM88_015716 [Heracleum sosnowskyi]
MFLDPFVVHLTMPAWSYNRGKMRSFGKMKWQQPLKGLNFQFLFDIVQTKDLKGDGLAAASNRTLYKVRFSGMTRNTRLKVFLSSFYWELLWATLHSQSALYGPLLLDTGMTVERNKIHRRVVPYNRGLLLKYQGLINVERVGHCINSCSLQGCLQVWCVLCATPMRQLIHGSKNFPYQLSCSLSHPFSLLYKDMFHLKVEVYCAAGMFFLHLKYLECSAGIPTSMEQSLRKRGRPRVPVTKELLEAGRLSQQRWNRQQRSGGAIQNFDYRRVELNEFDPEKDLDAYLQLSFSQNSLWLSTLSLNYTVLLTPTHLAIVMEYASGGELFDRICTSGRFSEHEARYFFQQLISWVSFCHAMQICHRDLKLENTLLRWHMCLKTLKVAFLRSPEEEVVALYIRLPKESNIGHVLDEIKTKVQGLLAELTVVEEEITLLERKVDELKLNIYREKQQTQLCDGEQLLELQPQWSREKQKHLFGREAERMVLKSFGSPTRLQSYSDYRNNRTSREMRQFLCSSKDIRSMSFTISSGG